MIYLLQDCYKDLKGEYHDVLKIGYSKNSFFTTRGTNYNTHNFGYKFLGEREGSVELENYLHQLFNDKRLTREWFSYSEEIISTFWEISENDVETQFTSREELEGFIREYILKNFIQTKETLDYKFTDNIILELRKINLSCDFLEKECRKEILDVFSFFCSEERKFFETLDFTSPEINKLLQDCSLILQEKQLDLNKKIFNFYKTLLKNTKVIDRGVFNNKQSRRRNATKRLLNLYSKAIIEEQSEYINKLKSGITVSRYQDDFVSISSKTGLPEYNKYLEAAGDRALEIVLKELSI